MSRLMMVDVRGVRTSQRLKNYAIYIFLYYEVTDTRPDGVGQAVWVARFPRTAEFSDVLRDKAVRTNAIRFRNKFGSELTPDERQQIVQEFLNEVRGAAEEAQTKKGRKQR